MQKLIWCHVLAALMFLVGCVSVKNNYLRPEDFAHTLQQHGIKVDRMRSLPPEPFRATSGAALLVAGSEIGVYKFDQNSHIQAERIAHIAETRRTYINGIPYPVIVYGAFMFMGLEKNPEKRAIIKAIADFK